MTSEQLVAEIGAIKATIGDFTTKATAEIKTFGDANSETKSVIQKLTEQVKALETKLQTAPVGGSERKSVTQQLEENEDLQKLARDGRGTAIIKFKGLHEFERKTTITTSAVGGATSGVLNIERDAGIEMQAMQQLRVRDLFRSIPTSNNAIDFVKVDAFTSAASPQVEASAKGESALTFTTATANVRTIAHWIPATRQILADMPGLRNVIDEELIYGLKLREEVQMLIGSGSGNDLNGLVTGATAFSTALMGSGIWHKADIIRRAKQQLATANEITPEWVVMNDVDWADIELAKDTARQYLSGYSGMLYTPAGPVLWGLRVVLSNSMASGTFLVGNSRATTIRDREGVQIEVSTEHSDYFTKNLVAIRCEERLALLTRRPASYIYGTFTTSPA